jgi:two-component system chemotaxis response regulator CheB
VDAEDKEDLLPGVAYIAPPGYHLLIEAGSVALSVDPPVSHARPSIDVLFESAADVYGPGAVGVVLTGTGQDGAAGLARIKQRGGRTVVQDPTTATRSAMPRAAMASTIVDWILPLDMIGPRLVEIVGLTGQDTAPRLVAPESPVARS